MARWGGQTLQLPTHTKRHVAFRLAHSKGQDQAHFDCEYLTNDDREGKHYYCPKYYGACRLLISIFRVDLDLSNDQLGRRNGVSTNILAFLFLNPKKVNDKFNHK